jgi:hypothetical protein
MLGVVQPCLALLQSGLLLGAGCAAICAELLCRLRADVALLLFSAQVAEAHSVNTCFANCSYVLGFQGTLAIQHNLCGIYLCVCPVDGRSQDLAVEAGRSGGCRGAGHQQIPSNYICGLGDADICLGLQEADCKARTLVVEHWCGCGGAEVQHALEQCISGWHAAARKYGDEHNALQSVQMRECAVASVPKLAVTSLLLHASKPCTSSDGPTSADRYSTTVKGLQGG